MTDTNEARKELVNLVKLYRELGLENTRQIITDPRNEVGHRLAAERYLALAAAAELDLLIGDCGLFWRKTVDAMLAHRRTPKDA